MTDRKFPLPPIYHSVSHTLGGNSRLGGPTRQEPWVRRTSFNGRATGPGRVLICLALMDMDSPTGLILAGFPCWKTSIGKQVGPRIQRQKELNITINNWILWKIVEWALNCKSIYKGNWPSYIGRSHTNECHHSAGPDRHLWTDLVATLKFSLHGYRPHRGGQNLNSQHSPTWKAILEIN